MTEFSNYLNRIVTRRGLKCVQAAEVCNVDTSVMFRWLNGRALPKSWERLESVAEKLHLTSHEISTLKNAYRKELLGEEKGKCINEIVETIHALGEAQKNLCGYMWDGLFPIYEISFRNAAGIGQEFLKMENKAEVWRCIQNLLEVTSVQKSKRLCLKLHAFPEILLMQLKQFSRKMTGGRLDVLICMNSGTEDIKLEKLKWMKEMMDLLSQEKYGKIFCSNIWDTEEWQGNWIVAEDFFMQFSDDMSQGMLTRNTEWAAFFQESFEKIEKECKPIYRKEISRSEYVERERAAKHDKTAILGYMPYISIDMAEWQTFAGDDSDGIPERKPLLSCFAREGLLEFLEKGYAVHYSLHEPLDMRQRYKMLDYMISRAERESAFHYIMLKENVLDMNGICVKLRSGTKDSLCVEIWSERNKMEEIEISDTDIKEEYRRFFKYLPESGLAYGEKETLEIMKGILKKYGGNENDI